MSKVIKALRLRSFYCDLEEKWEVGSIFVIILLTLNAVTRPPLPPCMGEGDDILDEHLQRSIIKLKESEMSVDSYEVVCILVDSFARKLNSWASDNATSINILKKERKKEGNPLQRG